MQSQLQKDAELLLDFLREKKDALSPLLIMTHDYPDPDALASAFALHDLAEKAFAITSRIVYDGIIGRMENREMVRILKMPVHKLKAADLKKYNCIALVDTQGAFENNSFPKNRKATIVIDQHPSDKKPLAELAIVDVNCGATSVILAQCLLMLETEINPRVATALTYGILTDTLNLYRSHSPELIEIYLKILSHSDLKALAHIQNPVRSRKFFTTLGRGIQNAMRKRDLLVSHLGSVEHPDLVAQIADFLLTYQDACWSVCTGRYKGKLHVSLRTSKANVDAGEILRDAFENRGQAGGHDVIAGGSVKLGENAEESVWTETENTIIARLTKRLRIPAKREFAHPFRNIA